MNVNGSVERPPRLILISPGSPRLSAWTRWIGELEAHEDAALLIREPVIEESRIERVLAACTDKWRAILHVKTPKYRTYLARDAGLGVHYSRPLLDHAPEPREARLIGYSCHSAAELERAFLWGASYALLSPIFKPTSKASDERAPLGISAMRHLASERPVLALGGINADRFREVVRVGGYGGAVLGHVLAAANFGEARRNWEKLRQVLIERARGELEANEVRTKRDDSRT
jgi:thiamine monophosphate synthase